MSTSAESTPVAARAPRGTVELSVELPIPPDEAWLALTDPAWLARWFGDLDGRLAPGERARFTFGDGDFFDVVTLEAQPPRRLVYQWRFLGTGLTDRVTWRIHEAEGGSRVTVTDEQPRRTENGVREMVEGWSDFTERLEGFAATGRVTRYDWRREFEGSVRIGVPPERAWDLLFTSDAAARWLPFALQPGTVQLGDEEEPTQLRVSAPSLSPPHQARFQLSAEGWLRATRVRIELAARDGGTALCVAHLGWEEISRDPGEAMRQRRRFARVWVRALERARNLAGGEDG